MTGQSKHAAGPAASDGLDDAAKRRNLQVLHLSCFAVMSSMMIVMQSQPILVARGLGGDKIKTVTMLSRMMSASALIEFLLNPIIGGLSDTFGRKPFLMLAPGLTVLLRAMIARNPSLRNIVIGRIAVSALIPVFMTAMQSAIADMFRNSDATKLAGITGNTRAMTGLSMVAGSLLGGRLTAQDVLSPFRVSVATSLATFAAVAAAFRETLPLAERRPTSLRTGNPLRFLRLFQGAPLFAKLNMIHALNYAPMWIMDINAAFSRDVRKWGPAQQGRFISTVGLIGMCHGMLTGRTVALLGAQAHNRASMVLSVVAHVMWAGAVNAPRAYAACVVDTTKMNNATADVLGAQLGAQEGLGRGEMEAARANLDAVVKIAAPLVYARLYDVGTRAGVPGLPYFAAAASVACGGLIGLSIAGAEWEPPPPPAGGGGGEEGSGKSA